MPPNSASRGESAVCTQCGMRLDDTRHEVLPDGCRGQETFPRRESCTRGESASPDRTALARRLEAGGHGGCAHDLEAAADPDVVAVAYAIVQHLEEGCGAPREDDQILAEDIQGWADRQDRDLPGGNREEGREYERRGRRPGAAGQLHRRVREAGTGRAGDRVGYRRRGDRVRGLG